MAKNKRVKAKNVVVYVLVVLLVVAVIGSIAFLTNGFKSDISTFFLRVNGDYVAGDVADYVVSKSEPLNVETIYLFEDSSEEVNKGYKASIKANEQISFNFAVDGEMHSFNNDISWNDAFDIVSTEKGFMVMPKDDTFAQLLCRLFDREEVEFSIPDDVKNLFCLTVSSYDDTKSFNVYFTMSQIRTGIVLDYTEIVF